MNDFVVILLLNLWPDCPYSRCHPPTTQREKEFTMPAKIRLLIIDPQNDFCDGPSNGSLPVTGAYDDMTRLASMLDRLGHRIDDISVTLDSHRTIDVAHSPFWVDSKGVSPSPFTMITAA